ncbi:PIR Superfamily Protein [Plasmodium ovale wallikeri]|uniref:Plasmodium vivax Vir protein, putative n=2 Tax=Plasmodium ovale TaxID=36330 RepID=A0A1C3KJN3_PLAOA|nr:PIR Superfamily Protein [Plasmodium ovale wallikeri]SBT74105.1 Plasmodium vivax Vir protein, putative [Plasmodium ovale]
MENRVNILKNKLESFNFDLMLNNPVTLCPKCTLCDSVNVNEKKKNEPWFKIFCYQFVRNLETAESINMSKSKDIRESRCRSLKYWIYDKIVNSYQKIEINSNDNIIDELLKVWTNFNGSDVNNALSSKCKVPEITEFTNIEKMKREKKMSDYCENYNELKSLLTKTFYGNCHIYYDYFKDSFLEFSKIAEEQYAECLKINNCYNFCKNYDPAHLINKSVCEVVEISKDMKEYIKKEECDTLTAEAVSKKTCETKEVRISEFTFSDNRAIILILFSLWGILLSFLYLYKMTPVQSWISNKLRKKIIIRDDFHEESDNESLDGDYENIERNMQNVGYNISYNSDWNSTQ